jgi:6-phosphogluconolactonase
MIRMVWALLVLGALSIPASLLPAAEPAVGPVHVYVGTYTTAGKKESRGIYRFEFDPATGKSGTPHVVAECANPSFLAFGPGGETLYAVNELGNAAPEFPDTGALTGYRLNRKTGELTKLNSQATAGKLPCHLIVDQAGKNVLAVNYATGNAICLPRNPDGTLEPISSMVQHSGSSANPQRQAGPHAHSIHLSPDERFAIVCDLGIDQVRIYDFDREKHALDSNANSFVTARPGAGPRHFAFHPDGRHAFQNNELDYTVTAYRYDPEQGVLHPLQTLSTIPEGKRPPGGPAEVAVHPTGKFVYVSNRGPDSIAMYQVQPDFTLKSVGFASTQGKTPRHFRIDPTGRYLFAANQDSDSIVLFTINQDTGELTPTGDVIHVPVPVFVGMLPIE